MAREGFFGIACGVGAIIVTILQWMYPQISPYVGWTTVSLLSLSCIYLVIKGVRLKGKEQSKPFILTPHTYALGLSGMTGYPNEPENAEWLLLEVSVSAIDKPIDTLDLIIDGNPIPADHWPGKNVAAFNVYFKVTEWRWKGKKNVELIAHVSGETHSSGRVPIDFNVEHWGSHRI